MRPWLALSLLGACSSDGGHLLKANMQGATAVGISKTAGTTSPRLGGLVPVDTAAATTTVPTLMRIDMNGMAVPILDAEFPVWHEVVTPTHVVVDGYFQDIATQDSSDPINCHLIAFPRTANDEPVKCLVVASSLTAENVGGGPGTNPDWGSYGYNDHPGMVGLGNDVYFALRVDDPSMPNNPGSELRKWTSGADDTELLIHLNPGGGGLLYQPFVAEGASNVCVVGQPPQGGVQDGQTYCSPLAQNNWRDINVPVAGGDRMRTTTIQVGHSVLVGGGGGMSHVLNLDTAAATAITTTTGWPYNWDQAAMTTDGHLVGIWMNQIVAADNQGTVLILDQSVSWSRFLSDGNTYAWIYGSSKLQRIDLATGVIDATNYLGDTGLLQVTDMSLSSDNRLRMDGTGSSGQPVIVSIDTVSGQVQVTTEDLPRLQAVTKLL